MSLDNIGTKNLLEERISFYSQQAELYDQINCVLVFFFLFLIFLIVIVLLKLILKTNKNYCMNDDFHNSHSNNNKLKKTSPTSPDNLIMKQGNIKNFIISLLFCSITAIQTLFIYIFAINCRKVAIFRGYLNYLEGYYNNITNTNIHNFNPDIIDSFFRSVDTGIPGKTFFSNIYGPIALCIFMVIILVGCVYFSLKYLNTITCFSKVWLVNIFYIFYFIFTIAFIILCLIDLSTNTYTIDLVNSYCVS